MTSNSENRDLSFGASNQTVVSPSIGDGQNPPDLSRDTRRAFGCIAAVLFVFILGLTVVITAGVVVVRNVMARQAELARLDAERAAEQRELLRKQQELVMKENEAFNMEAARLEAEREAELKRAIELENKKQQEREKQQLEMLQKWKEEERKKQESMSRGVEDMAFLAAVSNSRYQLAEFRKQAKSDYVLPNNGQAGGGLSWRVHLLPYIGQNNLYQRFKLDEPWDSEHNRPLVLASPDFFRCSADGKTRMRSYLNVDGEGWPYVRVGDITDGLSETVAIIGASSDQAIEWTRPDDLEKLVGKESVQKFLTNGPLDGVLSKDMPNKRSFGILMGDFRFYEVPEGFSADSMLALVTHDAQEIVSLSEIGNRLNVNFIPSVNLPVAKLEPQEEANSAKEKLLLIGKAFETYRTSISPDQNSPYRRRVGDLSWRVHLLPFIGEEGLYKRFKLEEPWDSANNFKLIAEMPSLYQLGTGVGRTRFCAPGIAGNPKNPLESVARSSPDFVGAMTLVYFAGSTKAHYWTREEQWGIDGNDLAGSLGWQESDTILSCTSTGKFLQLPPRLHLSKIVALLEGSPNRPFDVEQALANPEAAFRAAPRSMRATPIKGSVELPKIPAVKLSQKLLLPLGGSDEERLRKLAIAILSFEGTFHKTPLFMTTNTGAPSGLSWRVHLLPLLGQKPLYERFALSEPWDSPTNLQAASQMPEIYGPSADDVGKTDICALTGGGAMLGLKESIPACNDSVTNTIMLIRVGKSRRVFWTKPEDIPFDKTLKFSELVGADPYLLTVLGDGKVLPLPAKFPESLFQALASARGSELVDAATVRRLALHSLNQPVASVQSRMDSEQDRLSKASYAMLMHDGIYKHFPPGLSLPPANAPMPLESFCLSWRVHILPLLGYKSLYRQFRLEEPWDSEHNKQLLPYMPDLFRDEEDPGDSFTTRMQIVVGKGSPFPEVGASPAMKNLSDGASNTLQIMIAPAGRAVPWTQPLDYEVDLETADFEELRQGEGLVFSTFDGAIRRLPPDFDVKLLKALITSNGGEVIDGSKYLLDR